MTTVPSIAQLDLYSSKLLMRAFADYTKMGLSSYFFIFIVVEVSNIVKSSVTKKQIDIVTYLLLTFSQ